MRTAILDGDTLLFAAASSSEYECQWDTWLFTLHADLNAAIAKLDASIEEIQRDLKADEIIVALSDNERWRPKVMPEYKSNRRGRKPICYTALRDYCHEVYPTYQRPSLEGDDILGILATHPSLVKGEKIMVAIDKDLRTIPGTLYNYDKKELTEISVEEADKFFLMQTLAGDTTDGYSGCPGIGMSTAEKLLDAGMVLAPREKVISRGPRKGTKEIEWVEDRPGTPWEVVVSVYASKGLPESAALRQARVARILRAEDYDFQKKEVKLWTPPRS